MMSDERQPSDPFPPREFVETPAGQFVSFEIPPGHFDPPDTEAHRERMRLFEEARRRDIPRLIALRKEMRRRYREGSL